MPLDDRVNITNDYLSKAESQHDDEWRGESHLRRTWLIMVGRKSEKAYSGITLPAYMSTSSTVEPSDQKKCAVELTADPCLPVDQTRPDVLPFEFLAGRTELIISLQPSDHDSPLFFSQEPAEESQIRSRWQTYL